MHFIMHSGVSFSSEIFACLPISSHSTKIGKNVVMWGMPSPHLAMKVMLVGADRIHQKGHSLWTVTIDDVSRKQEVWINHNWSLWLQNCLFNLDFASPVLSSYTLKIVTFCRNFCLLAFKLWIEMKLKASFINWPKTIWYLAFCAEIFYSLSDLWTFRLLLYYKKAVLPFVTYETVLSQLWYCNSRYMLDCSLIFIIHFETFRCSESCVLHLLSCQIYFD
jgi:hypothetical protein